MDYVTVKWVHILSSTVLFGTGVGTAFFLLLVSVQGQVGPVAAVSRVVVLADWIFTTPTVILQPLTGFYLLHLAGFAMSSRWIAWSITLYCIAIACWLPVVWLQVRMRNLAVQAQRDQTALPNAYWLCLRVWVLLGIPAFIAFVAIFYLMVAKPT